MSEAVKIKLSKKDLESDQDVRWCPGCGDYAILATVQRTLAQLGIRRENTVFISGIGCSSRFPYYMNTFGSTRSTAARRRSRRDCASRAPISISG